MSDGAVKRAYADVRADFAGRHWQTEQMFDDRFAEVAQQLKLDPAQFSTARRLITKRQDLPSRPLWSGCGTIDGFISAAAA